MIDNKNIRIYNQICHTLFFRMVPAMAFRHRPRLRSRRLLRHPHCPKCWRTTMWTYLAQAKLMVFGYLCHGDKCKHHIRAKAATCKWKKDRREEHTYMTFSIGLIQTISLHIIITLYIIYYLCHTKIRFGNWHYIVMVSLIHVT